jgi:RHS repeat-associated protein
VALVETRTAGTDAGLQELIRYQFTNHLDSASLELDDQAQIVSYEEFFPYGSTSYQAVRNQTDTPKRYRYTGKERDDENDLYYHGARYYAPWLGRWTSSDPAGISAGINSYLYASASPVCMLDRNGMDDTAPPAHPEDTDIHQYWKEGPPSPSDADPPAPPPTTTPSSGSGGKKSHGCSVWGAIKHAVSSAWEAIKHAASSAWAWIKGAISSAWGWIKSTATAVWDWISKAAAAAWDWTKHAASAAWNWTKHAAATVWTGIKRGASAAWNWTKKAAATVWSGLKTAGAATGNWFKKATITIWKSPVFKIIGHLTWGLPGTLVGLLVALFNLTIGNLITAIHNAASDDAHKWAYASLDVGGPKGDLPMIGNYGGVLSAGGFGAAVTLGPFVFFQGTPAGGGSVRKGYEKEAASSIYGSTGHLQTAQHEKGHTEQNLVYGPLTLIFGLVFSLLPNALHANPKDPSVGWYWFDRQANKWGGANNPFESNPNMYPAAP